MYKCFPSCFYSVQHLLFDFVFSIFAHVFPHFKWATQLLPLLFFSFVSSHLCQFRFIYFGVLRFTIVKSKINNWANLMYFPDVIVMNCIKFFKGLLLIFFCWCSSSLTLLILFFLSRLLLFFIMINSRGIHSNIMIRTPSFLPSVGWPAQSPPCLVTPCPEFKCCLSRPSAPEPCLTAWLTSRGRWCDDLSTARWCWPPLWCGCWWMCSYCSTSASVTNVMTGRTARCSLPSEVGLHHCCCGFHCHVQVFNPWHPYSLSNCCFGERL